MQQHQLSMPPLVHCFAMGTHSWWLREWENPKREMVGFFHRLQIFHTNKGPIYIFFYGRLATLGWDPDWWWWIVNGHFLDYTIKDGREYIINGNPDTTCAADMGFLPINYRFLWSHVWDPLRSGKNCVHLVYQA
jgi:hypothetical protein